MELNAYLDYTIVCGDHGDLYQFALQLINSTDYYDDLDGDSHPDHGGKLVAIRGPRPGLPPINAIPATGTFQANYNAVVSALGLGGDGRQFSVSTMTYNSFGQPTGVTEPDGDQHAMVYGGPEKPASLISSILDVPATKIATSIVVD